MNSTQKRLVVVVVALAVVAGMLACSAGTLISRDEPTPTPTKTPKPTYTVTLTPTNTPIPTDTPVPPTPTPAPLFYRGIGPIFMPTNNPWVTIWAKIYGGVGNGYPVPGWRIQVKKDGVVVATSDPSG